MRVAHIPEIASVAWDLLSVMFDVLCSLLKSRAASQLESVALRHQIGVFQLSAKKRLSLNNPDRLLWIGRAPAGEVAIMF